MDPRRIHPDGAAAQYQGGQGDFGGGGGSGSEESGGPLPGPGGSSQGVSAAQPRAFGNFRLPGGAFSVAYRGAGREAVIPKLCATW